MRDEIFEQGHADGSDQAVFRARLSGRRSAVTALAILVAVATATVAAGSSGYFPGAKQVFRDLARKHHTSIVPMIYKGFVNVPGTIQPDGIHPTAKGSEIIARTLLPVLEPLLRKGQ